MTLAPPDPQSAAAAPPATVRLGVRDGDLTTTWRVVLGAAWVLSVFAYAAVWQASVQIGISTWWLGPRAQPTEFYIRILPFVIPLVMLLALAYDVRRPARLSMVGAVASAVIAVPDFERTITLGVLELTIAGLLFAISVAALAGRYRIRS